MYRVTAKKPNSPISEYVADWQCLLSALHDAECLERMGFTVTIKKV